MRETLSLLLETEGYSVEAATHGEEAQQLLKQGDRLPDLILLDMQMPVMDGETFLRTLPDIGVLGATDIPVVVVTASRQQPELATAILRKPFELDELLATVTRYAKSPSR